MVGVAHHKTHEEARKERKLLVVESLVDVLFYLVECYPTNGSVKI